MAIYQDLVDLYGFTARYSSVMRFARKLRHHEPEQFDRLEFLPGEEMQVDYGEGAPTRVPGTDRYRKPRLFVATLRYSRRMLPPRRVEVQSGDLGPAARAGLEVFWRQLPLRGPRQPEGRRPQARPVRARAQPRLRGHAGPLRRGRRPGQGPRPESQGRRGERDRPHPGHGLEGSALRVAARSRTTSSSTGRRKWAASRIHGSARRQVQAMFEEERPLLQPLPSQGMQYFTESQRTVCDDSCVRVDHSSYAARPAPIGSRVLVRVFEHRIEIRDLKTQALLRTHARVERPGTVVLPMEERVFNPSRETRRILAQAKAIGSDAERLCEMLFAIEGRVGQRKLWGIVGLADRYPRRLVDRACAQAIDRRHPQL